MHQSVVTPSMRILVLRYQCTCTLNPETTVNRNVKPYEDESYVDLTLSIRAQRLSLYYHVNYTFQLMLMTFLVLLVFIAPYDCGEKITFSAFPLQSTRSRALPKAPSSSSMSKSSISWVCVTSLNGLCFRLLLTGLIILLSVGFVLTVLQERMPRSSDSTPQYNVYITTVLIIIFVDIIITSAHLHNMTWLVWWLYCFCSDLHSLFALPVRPPGCRGMSAAMGTLHRRLHYTVLYSLYIGGAWIKYLPRHKLISNQML